MDIEKFSVNALDKIKSVSIVDSNEFYKISKLSKELQRIFEVHQVFRTETEMRYSVLDDVRFPTPASKYWQCIREQNVFFSNLVYLSCDYEEQQGLLEIAEIELEEIIPNEIKSNALLKIKKSKIKKMQFSLMEMRITAKDRIREIALWEKIKNELKSKYDFDINDVNTNQFEALKKRWELEAEIGGISGNNDSLKNALIGLTTMNNN